jgi:hypothetical protein
MTPAPTLRRARPLPCGCLCGELFVAGLPEEKP